MISESKLEYQDCGCSQSWQSICKNQKLETLKITIIGAILFGSRGVEFAWTAMGEEIDDEIGAEDPEDEREFLDLECVEDYGCIVKWEEDDDINIRM